MALGQVVDRLDVEGATVFGNLAAGQAGGVVFELVQVAAGKWSERYLLVNSYALPSRRIQ